ncbi:MAG: DUF6325 family protein, partial [Candidatus Saccharimonadales bacterium]
SILSELSKAVESGAIRVVDLIFVIKDEEGNVTTAEIEDQSDELKEAASAFDLTGDLPLLTEEDVNKLGASMDNDTSAGVLVIEHLWAKGLKKALIDAGGELIAEGRVHSDKVSAAIEELALEPVKA